MRSSEQELRQLCEDELAQLRMLLQDIMGKAQTIRMVAGEAIEQVEKENKPDAGWA